MTYGYRLLVFKTDRRTKSGQRLVNTYEYSNYSNQAMAEEVNDLKRRLYKPADGWRLEFEPLTVMVRSLMTGAMVEIDYRDRGGPNDPSTERHWSM